MSSSAKFKARIIVEDGGTQEVEVWDDELSPFSEDGRRPIRDWAREHLTNYGNEGLRELLELPAGGNYEVVIEADINGYHSSSPNGDDYDEDLTINSIKQQQIPEDYYDLDPLTPLIIDDLMDADKVDELEVTLDDEETAHQETLRMLSFANEEVKQLRLRLLSAAGDDLCRLTQEEIKELSSGGVKIPPEEEFLASCKRFHQQLAAGPGVLNGCLTLAQLIAENETLRQQIEELKADAEDTPGRNE